MVDATKATESDWMDINLVQNSPTKKAIIVGGGQYEEGKFGEQLVINVEIDGKKKKYSPNRDSATNLVNRYGSNTEGWVGRIINVEVRRLNSKDLIIAIPTQDVAKVKE